MLWYISVHKSHPHPPHSTIILLLDLLTSLLPLSSSFSPSSSSFNSSSGFCDPLYHFWRIILVQYHPPFSPFSTSSFNRHPPSTINPLLSPSISPRSCRMNRQLDFPNRRIQHSGYFISCDTAHPWSWILGRERFCGHYLEQSWIRLEDRINQGVSGVTLYSNPSDATQLAQVVALA